LNACDGGLKTGEIPAISLHCVQTDRLQQQADYALEGFCRFAALGRSEKFLDGGHAAVTLASLHRNSGTRGCFTLGEIGNFG
jgi:hypothetical protein